MNDRVDLYLSVGDSMSIDIYPYFDLSWSNPEVSQKVGAASLLYQNNASIWPEFEGMDLASNYPGIQHVDVCRDGATTYDFIDGSFLSEVSSYRDKSIVVTITLCGNDLLGIISSRTRSGVIDSLIDEVWTRYLRVIALIEESFPEAKLVLTTIYDPTDGSGKLPGYPGLLEHLSWLEHTNDLVRGFAREHEYQLADVHKHFLGHGLSVHEDERWFWKPNPIEPSARGASEIRRLWLEALSGYGLISK